MTITPLNSNPKIAEFRKNAEIIPRWNDYVYNKEGSIYQNILTYGREKRKISTSVLFVGAVEVPRENAYFLGGPFESNDSFFGGVSLVKIENAPNEEDLISAYIKKDITTHMTSPSYMPYGAASKVKAVFGDASEHLFDRTLGLHFSDLDFKYGKDEIPEDFKAESRDEKSICSLFFNTKGALAKVLEVLTDQEIEEWKSSLTEVNKIGVRDHLRYGPLAEKPYMVRFFGNDDSSWTLTFATEEEAVKFICEELPKGLEATDKMWFTN